MNRKELCHEHAALEGQAITTIRPGRPVMRTCPSARVLRIGGKMANKTPNCVSVPHRRNDIGRVSISTLSSWVPRRLAPLIEGSVFFIGIRGAKTR